jgi:Sodium:dicarboxylate symporter family
VVLAAVLGVAVGLLLPDVGAAFKPLNDWFIAVVKMIVIPVVFCVVTTGIASMDNLRKAGRIGVKAIGYCLVLSPVSMLIGLLVANAAIDTSSTPAAPLLPSGKTPSSPGSSMRQTIRSPHKPERSNARWHGTRANRDMPRSAACFGGSFRGVVEDSATP